MDHFIKLLAFVTSIKQTHADERLYNFYISFKALIRVEKRFNFRFVSYHFFEPFYMIFEPFPIRIKPLLSRLMAVLYSF